MPDPFPFVLITSPSDHRLIRNDNQVVTGETTIRALVFGQRQIESVTCQVEKDAPVMMTKVEDGNYWTARINMPDTELCTIMVEAFDETGRPGRHTIQAATGNFKIILRPQNGSDASSIGEWPENGIFGTQLGPNRNGKSFENGPKKTS